MVCGGYESAWKEGNHLEVFWENCIDIIENFLNKGYDVVFNYIITKGKLEVLKDKFKDTETKFVVLISDKETLIKRDKSRPKDLQMNERVIVLLNQMKEQGFDDNNILDTSKLNIKKITDEILNDDRFILKNLEIKTNENIRYVGKVLDVKIDRMMGSLHPKYKYLYQVNYGYIPGTVSGDGEELDAYILGVFDPIEEFKGECIAVIHRLNDNDDKLVITPKGRDYSDEQIIALTEFQEKFFESEILR